MGSREEVCTSRDLHKNPNCKRLWIQNLSSHFLKMIFCSRWRQGKVQKGPTMATSPQDRVHLRGLTAAPSLPRDPSHGVVQMGMSYLPSTPGGTALFLWGGGGNWSGWAVAQEPQTTSPPAPHLFPHEGRLRKVTFLFAFGFLFFFIYTVVSLPSLFKKKK